jgi:hypothetical protein
MVQDPVAPPVPVSVAAPPDADALRAARRDLRDQIARLEQELSRRLVASFPRREPLRSGRPAPALAGPRLLSLGELERVRDELADRLSAFERPYAAGLLEDMYRAPERHRWQIVTSEQLGEPDCRRWQVRPRLGLIGMLAGWWHVKISSGCPLAG